MIDEVHLLGESERGSALEAGVVSRIKMVSKLPEMREVGGLDRTCEVIRPPRWAGKCEGRLRELGRGVRDTVGGWRCGGAHTAAVPECECRSGVRTSVDAPAGAGPVNSTDAHVSQCFLSHSADAPGPGPVRGCVGHHPQRAGHRAVAARAA